MSGRVVDRDALVGVVIAGGFGVGWALWAASGLTGGAAEVVRIGGVGIGAAIVVGALLRLRGAGAPASTGDGDSGSMFRTRGYLVSVAAEVIALVGGNALLAATGNDRYVAAWVAFIVGVHFLGFGRLFTAMFYGLGAAFIAAAVVGAVAGAAAGTRAAVEASTGLIAAGSLFAAGCWGLLSSAGRASRPGPDSL